MKLVPLITEKTLSDAQKKFYTFKVPTSATKHQIKEAVKRTFGVNVLKVRTMNYKPEKKRVGRNVVVVAASKKAIVQVSDKDKIDLFEEK